MKGKVCLAILLIGLVGSNFLNVNSCENKCSDCQRTVYKLKYQRISDCKHSVCKTTVLL